MCIGYGNIAITLYKKLFNKVAIQEHRALSDVKICAKCYFELKEIKRSNTLDSR